MGLHSDVSGLEIQTILSLILGSQTIRTCAARVEGKTAHDAVSRGERHDGGTYGDDGAGSFVGCGAGERGGEGSLLDHAVCVAV